MKLKTYEREERYLMKQSKVPAAALEGENSIPNVKSIMSPPPSMSAPVSLNRPEKTVGASETSSVSLLSVSNASTPTADHRSSPKSQSMQSSSGSRPRRNSRSSIAPSLGSLTAALSPNNAAATSISVPSTPGGGNGSNSSSVGGSGGTGTSGGGGGQSSTTMMNMGIFSSTINTKVQDQHVSGRVFAYLQEASLVFSCGHWDWSVRVTSAENGKLLQILSQHHDVVTCLAVAKDYGSRWLVTGSRDCTIIVWEIILDRNQLASVHPIRTLYGHDETVTCVAIHPELDIIVSGSEDGTWITHNLRDGKYIRTVGNYEIYPKWWNKVTNQHSKDASRPVATSVPSALTSVRIPIAAPTSGGTALPPTHLRRAMSDQTTPFTGGIKRSPSDSNITDTGSISTKEDSAAGDSGSSVAPSETSTILPVFQIKAPIPTTPKRILPLPLALEQQLSPGDDGVSSIVHGGSSIFSFERPATTTPSLQPDSLLSGADLQVGSIPGPAAGTGNGNLGVNNSANSPGVAAAAALGRSQFWSVTWVGISKEGYIVTYSAEHQRLTTFSISGTFVASKKVPEALYAFAVSDDGMVLVTGGSACLITFRWVCSIASLLLLMLL